LRIALDTNVLLAAFATHGLCESLFATCLLSHELVTSGHILSELQRNLVDKIRMPARRAAEIVSFVREHAQEVVPADLPASVVADAEDLPVLGTAVAGRCDVLVTGDKDLVALGQIEGVPIVTPRQCYERLVG
jgi:uncharacterized protein